MDGDARIDAEDTEWVLSIGALARATGIPTETLRTWERRYAFPVPRRRASGHRRYSVETVDHLRLIKRALDEGHRPSTVVAAGRATLEMLLSLRAVTGSSPEADPQDTTGWIEAAKRLDGPSLQRMFWQAWLATDVLHFAQDYATPFLVEVGLQWQQGKLGVGHEHFVTECMRNFLSTQWRSIPNAASPVVVLATLPGEEHELRLHIAALIAASCGLKVSFLGAKTPIDQIAAAVDVTDAVGAVIGGSVAADTRTTHSALVALRRRISSSASLVFGGAEIPSVEGVQVISDWAVFDRWCTFKTGHGHELSHAG